MDIDEFIQNPLASSSRRKRRREASSEYDPSVLKQIGGATMSGLSALGNVLDIPGSISRDIQIGQNPLDQLAPWNWTSSEHRATGRDVLRKAGVISQQDTPANFAAGLAHEIATDPLTYLTLGGSALTKSGKVARAAGFLDDATKLTKAGPRVSRLTTSLDELISGAKKTKQSGQYARDMGLADDAFGYGEGIASNVAEGSSRAKRAATAMEKAGLKADDVYDMPLGGLAAPIGPFRGLAGQTGVWGKAGGVGEKIAGAMDAAGKLVSESAPVRFGSMLFEHATRGQYDKEAQKLARMATTAQQAASPEARMEALKLVDELEAAKAPLYGTPEVPPNAGPPPMTGAPTPPGPTTPPVPPPFTPSTEWQEIPKGTSVPIGGQFRMGVGGDDAGKTFGRWPQAKSASPGPSGPLFQSDVTQRLEAQQAARRAAADEFVRQGKKRAEDAAQQMAKNVPASASQQSPSLATTATHANPVIQKFADDFNDALHKIETGPTSLGQRPGAMVKIAELRKSLPQYTDQEFNDYLREMRIKDQIHLDTPEGKTVKLTPEERARGLSEGQDNFAWATRGETLPLPLSAKQQVPLFQAGTGDMPGDFKNLATSEIAKGRMTGEELRSQLHAVRPKEADAVYALVEARASALGEKTDDYVGRKFAAVGKSTVAAAEQASGLKLPPGAKGVVHFADDGRAIIHAFESANASTMVHEIGHVFRQDLHPEDLAKAESWAGVQGGKWTVEAEEKFARGFEKYLQTGRAPTAALLDIFKKFKQWLTNVYQTVVNGKRTMEGSAIDLKISPEMKRVYDNLFTPNVQRAAVTPVEAAAAMPSATVAVGGNLAGAVAEAEKSGLSDKIEDLAAGMLSTRQIAAKLGVDDDLVDAVKLQRGVPSAPVGGKPTPEFQAFTDRVAARQAAAKPVTPKATGLGSRMKRKVELTPVEQAAEVPQVSQDSAVPPATPIAPVPTQPLPEPQIVRNSMKVLGDQFDEVYGNRSTPTPVPTTPVSAIPTPQTPIPAPTAAAPAGAAPPGGRSIEPPSGYVPPGDFSGGPPARELPPGPPTRSEPVTPFSEAAIAARMRKVVGPYESVFKQSDQTGVSASRKKAAQESYEAAIHAFAAEDKAEIVKRAADDVARAIGELSTDDRAPGEAIQKALEMLDINGVDPKTLEGVEQAVTKIREWNKTAAHTANAKGADITLLGDESGDPIQHLARYGGSSLSYKEQQELQARLTDAMVSTGKSPTRLNAKGERVPMTTAEMEAALPKGEARQIRDEIRGSGKYRIIGSTAVDQARQHETRTVPTRVIEDLLSDKNLRAKPGTDEGQQEAAGYIWEKYADYLDPNYDARSKADVAYGLAKWSEKNQGRPGFAKMMESRAAMFKTPEANNKAMQHAWELAEHMRVSSNRTRYSRGMVADQMKYAEEVMRKNAMMDVVHHYLRQSLADKPTAGSVPIETVFRDAKMDPETATKWFATQGGLSVAEASRIRIPKDAAAAVASVVRTQPGSVWGNKVGEVLDSLNNITRQHLTIPFPAFHFRNWSSGQYVNMVTAVETPQDAADYVKAYRQALAMPRAAAGATDDATKELWRELEAYRVLGQQSGQRGAVRVGMEDVTYGSGQASLPGVVERTPGLKQAGKAYQGAMRLGEKAMESAEFYNRVPLYLYYKNKGYSSGQAAIEVKKRHFDYSEMTDFERNVMKRGMLFYCVPDTAEALTRDGWKKYDAIEFGEEILTYNVDKDCLEWQPCLEVAAFQHDQELLSWNNSRHKLMFTHDHRWPVNRKAMNSKLADGTVRIHPAERKIVTGRELNSNHEFICAAEFVDDSESLLTPDEAGLLGWIVTDGTVQQRKPTHTPQARIYQHPNKFLEEVKEVAGGTTYPPHPISGTYAVGVKPDRLKPLLQYLDKDKLTHVVTRLSRSALEAMYDAMYKADGLVKEHRHQDSFASQHRGKREAFQIICTLLGKRGTKVAAGINVSHRRFMSVVNGMVKPEHFKGVVWCPRTENGTWVMRQRDTIVVTGNTFTRKMAPLMAETLLQRPGGALAQTIKATGKLHDQQNQPIPQYIKETSAIPLSNDKEGGLRFITGLGLPQEDAASFFPSPVNELLSRTTPLIKAPIEMATGTSLFQRGRPLDELDPNLGRLRSNIVEQLTGEKVRTRAKPLLGSNALEFVAANSPLSRVLSSARTLSDPRKSLLDKAVNLATGAKITDVSPASQDAELGKAIAEQERLLGGIVFAKPYIPKDVRAAMTPKQLADLAKLEQLTRAITKRKKERAAAER